MNKKGHFFHGVILLLFVVVSFLPVSLATAFTEPKMTVEWKYGIFGSGIGLSGISLYDLEGDGRLEIIAGGSEGTFGADNFWYILKKRGSSYRQVWISAIYTSSISRIVVGDINNDSVPEIYVCLSNGTIHVYNGQLEDTNRQNFRGSCR